MGDGSKAAFFYGTLMAPQVLHRVCHGSTSPDNPIYATHNLKTCPAILHGYRRHKVRSADYPAIVPAVDSTVRGTYVTGLTEGDIWRLDIFEGDEYQRQEVKLRVLKEVGDASGKGNVEGDEVKAETYVWTDPVERLETAEWDFAEFQREKMRFWVGDSNEYAEVDAAVAEADREIQDGTGGRAFGGGQITHALEAQRNQEPLKSAV